MTGFNKKETLIRTICFMSFFVAINVLCSFLTTVAPLVGIILIIFLPLTSSLVEVMCKDRWYPIYAFATIGLSIVVSLSSIDFTIFYIVPSIFTGYIFGLCCKKGIPGMIAIFSATVIQTLLSFAFIPLINFITGTNILDVFAKIFRISSEFWFETLILFIFFVVALIQTILSYIVVTNELKKFIEPAESYSNQEAIAAISSIASLLILIPFIFFQLNFAYLFLSISFYFVVFVIIEQTKTNNRFVLIIDGGFLFITVLLFAALNRFLKEGYEMMLLGIFPLLVSCFSILHSFLKKPE